MVTPININYRCNEQIRVTPVRVINEANEQLGVMSNVEALRMARETGVDLVEVAPNVRPPVCRLMNYGKFKYLQKKNVKKHHEQQMKEVRLRPKTDTHDRGLKVKQAIRFFQKGDKVQFTMVFRGRERARREVAFQVFRDVLAAFGTKVKVERPPTMDGRNMVMILSASKDAFGEVPKDDHEDAVKAPSAPPPANASEAVHAAPVAAQPADA